MDFSLIEGLSDSNVKEFYDNIVEGDYDLLSKCWCVRKDGSGGQVFDDCRFQLSTRALCAYQCSIFGQTPFYITSVYVPGYAHASFNCECWFNGTQYGNNRYEGEWAKPWQ